MILTCFSGLDVLYHHAKFGKIVLRMLAVGVKMWCFFLSHCDAGGLCVRGVCSSNKYFVTVYVSILMWF